MKCLYLYNPNSGKGKYGQKKDYIINRLKERFESVDYLETLSRENLLDTITNKSFGYDAIVFSGGDGTVNDVVNAVMKLDKKPVLGYLPSGTCNDFARSMKIGKNLDNALDVIVNGYAKTYDIFKVNERYGVYVCASGIFTSASFDTKQKSKRKFGKLAYYLHSFKEIFHTKATNFKVSKDGATPFDLNAVLVLNINSCSVAGYKLNKGVNLNDGEMEFVAVKQKDTKKRLTLKSLLVICKLFLFGVKSVKKYKCVEYFKFKTCQVQNICDVPINIDGECLGKGDYNIEVYKNKLNIFTK